MPETLTDEQILGIDDSPAPEVSSETPETSAPVETQPEKTATETSLKPDQAKDATTAQPKQADKTQQQAKPTAEQSQDANAVNAEKAAELDRADAAFTNSDYVGMGEVFEEMFGENPHACCEAMWTARQFLQMNAPQELAQHDRMVVSDQLGQLGVWNALEIIHEAATKAGDENVAQLLNQFAGGLRQQYGLGPATPEAQEAAWQSYNEVIGAKLIQIADTEIRHAFGERFSSVQPGDQEQLLMAGRIAVADLLRKDTKLASAFEKLHDAYSHKGGVDFYYDAFTPKMRALVPRVIQNLANQYSDLFKKPAAPTRGRIATPPAPAKAESTDVPLGFSEASRMSERDILNSGRPSDLTRPDRRARKLSRDEVLRSRAPFSTILDDALEVAG